MFYARALAEAELGAQSKSSIRDAQIGVGNITSEDFASMSLLVRTRPQLFCAGEVDKYITCYPGGIGEILKRVEHVEYYLPKKPVTDSKGSVPVLDIYVNNIPMVIPGSVSTFELVESNSIEYSNIQASSELNVDGKNSSTSLRDGFKDLCSVISKSAFSFSKFMFSVLRAPNLYHYSNDVI